LRVPARKHAYCGVFAHKITACDRCRIVTPGVKALPLVTFYLSPGTCDAVSRRLLGLYRQSTLTDKECTP